MHTFLKEFMESRVIKLLMPYSRIRGFAFGSILTLMWVENRDKSLQRPLERSVLPYLVQSDYRMQARESCHVHVSLPSLSDRTKSCEIDLLDKFTQNRAKWTLCGSRPLSDSSCLTGLWCQGHVCKAARC